MGRVGNSSALAHALQNPQLWTSRRTARRQQAPSGDLARRLRSDSRSSLVTADRQEGRAQLLDLVCQLVSGPEISSPFRRFSDRRAGLGGRGAEEERQSDAGASPRASK